MQASTFSPKFVQGLKQSSASSALVVGQDEDSTSGGRALVRRVNLTAVFANCAVTSWFRLPASFEAMKMPRIVARS
ncbi:hypothetical protein WJX74_002856 [Apatococcus lobatus]|uniref:Uncharacterized protein n=1 Tax=Apatococcus lobatus TaxID=904363 RepID=A0AAW1QY90_9CHLO